MPIYRSQQTGYKSQYVALKSEIFAFTFPTPGNDGVHLQGRGNRTGEGGRLSVWIRLLLVNLVNRLSPGAPGPHWLFQCVAGSDPVILPP